jgi:hypothetical protein
MKDSIRQYIDLLRLLFVSHKWRQDSEDGHRTCLVCGRRERPDFTDGVSMTAVDVLWDGYPRAHLKKS